MSYSILLNLISSIFVTSSAKRRKTIFDFVLYVWRVGDGTIEQAWTTWTKHELIRRPAALVFYPISRLPKAEKGSIWQTCTIFYLLLLPKDPKRQKHYWFYSLCTES